MKNIVLFVVFLIGVNVYGQNPASDSQRWKGKTTAERDAYSDYVPGLRILWNETTQQIEYKVGAGAWQSFGTGGDLWSDPVDADILSDGDQTRDIGSSSNRFLGIYAASFYGALDGSAAELSVMVHTPQVRMAGIASDLTPGGYGVINAPMWWNYTDDRLRLIKNDADVETIAFLSDLSAGADGLGTARNVGPFSVVDADNAILNNDAVGLDEIDVSEGTALQSIRINAAGTAPEWYTPGAGGSGDPDQDLSITGNTLTLTKQSGQDDVDLSPYLDNTDDQSLDDVIQNGSSSQNVTGTFGVGKAGEFFGVEYDAVNEQARLRGGTQGGSDLVVLTIEPNAAILEGLSDAEITAAPVNTIITKSWALANLSGGSGFTGNTARTFRTVDFNITAADQISGGNRIINTVNSAITVVATVDNVNANANSNYQLDVLDNGGQLDIVPGSGVTLQGNPSAQGSNNAARITGYGKANVVEITDGVFDVDGDITWFTVDTTAPLVQSATVENADPDALIVVFDEAVNITNVTGLSLDGDWTGTTITGINSGSGTTTLDLALDTPVANGETGNFVYGASNTIADLSGNPLASGSTAVTNNVSGGGGSNLYTENSAANGGTGLGSWTAHAGGSVSAVTDGDFTGGTAIEISNGTTQFGGAKLGITDSDVATWSGGTITQLDPNDVYTVSFEIKEENASQSGYYSSLIAGVDAGQGIPNGNNTGVTVNQYTLTIPAGGVDPLAEIRISSNSVDTASEWVRVGNFQIEKTTDN